MARLCLSKRRIQHACPKNTVGGGQNLNTLGGRFDFNFAQFHPLQAI
jgi:hypothetical protein